MGLRPVSHPPASGLLPGWELVALGAWRRSSGAIHRPLFLLRLPFPAPLGPPPSASCTEMQPDSRIIPLPSQRQQQQRGLEIYRWAEEKAGISLSLPLPPFFGFPFSP